MEELFDILHRFDYRLENVDQLPVVESPLDVDTVLQVSAAKDDELELDLLVDEAKDLIVVNELSCPPDRLDETLKDLGRVSLNLDSDTLLVQADTGEFGLWKDQGFAKTYQCVLSGEPEVLEMGKVDEALDQATQELAVHLGEDLQIYEVASDLPYIYSVELVEKSAENPIAADYHCDLHYHELTGAVYLDRLWIPEEKRFAGIGTATVDILKEALSEVGANYLYLKATESSESFWDRRSDFESIYRLNLRWARRMRRQMMRDPGWDRVYVRGQQLEKRLDYYGNHPGEDWDFFQAQKILSLA